MTPRENLLSLYRRQGYKYAPVQFQLCPSLEKKYREIAGDTPYEDYFEYPEGFATEYVPDIPVRENTTVDWTQFYPDGLKAGTVIDIYGVAHEPGSEASAHMTRMLHPMARFDSLEQIQAYPFPEFETDDISQLRECVNTIHASGKAAVGGMACTVWETAWYIRDMTQLMMDMSLDDPRATFLLDKITGLSSQRAATFARAGVDIIELGDDIGMQHSIMMSVSMYQTWLKPRLAKVIAAARKENPDVLIFYHSCGFVEPFIDDLIETGVDILNPVQPECMNFADIHATYGNRLSFNGTIGTQHLMPFGKPADIKKEIYRNLEIAGEKGGLMCCPTHMLEPEVPWENIEAYVKACKEFS